MFTPGNIHIPNLFQIFTEGHLCVIVLEVLCVVVVRDDHIFRVTVTVDVLHSTTFRYPPKYDEFYEFLHRCCHIYFGRTILGAYKIQESFFISYTSRPDNWPCLLILLLDNWFTLFFGLLWNIALFYSLSDVSEFSFIILSSNSIQPTELRLSRLCSTYDIFCKKWVNFTKSVLCSPWLSVENLTDILSLRFGRWNETEPNLDTKNIMHTHFQG